MLRQTLDENAWKLSISQPVRPRYYDDIEFFFDSPRPDDVPDWACVSDEEEAAKEQMKERKRREKGKGKKTEQKKRQKNRKRERKRKRKRERERERKKQRIGKKERIGRCS